MTCPLCDRPMSLYRPDWSLCLSCGLIGADHHEPASAPATTSPSPADLGRVALTVLG